MSTLSQFMSAIYQNEGGGTQAGMPLNNPFDLEDTSGNLQSFPSMDSGITAATNMIEKDASGNSSIYDPNESLSDYVTTYTGNNPNAASNVGSISGLNMSSPLSSLLSSSPDTSGDTFQSAENAISSAMASKTSGTSSLVSTVFQARYIVGIIGIIVILMGLFMFAISGIEGALGLGSHVVNTAGRAKTLGKAAAELMA